MPAPTPPVHHFCTSESALSSPSGDSITLPQSVNATPFVQVDESSNADLLPNESAQNTTDPVVTFINNLIAQSEKRDAAFERLLKLHNEMQMKLSPVIGSAAAFQLRDAIWDATCDFRDACMER